MKKANIKLRNAQVAIVKLKHIFLKYSGQISMRNSKYRYQLVRRLLPFTTFTLWGYQI